MAKAKSIQYHEAVGRRKSAVARVRLYILGKEKTITLEGVTVKVGDIMVNRKKASEVFSSAHEKVRFQEPLALTNSLERFVVSAHITGGERSSQLDAFIHSLARALEKVAKEEYRPTLKKAGLLTRDPRIRERRKVGTGGKARRQKQSPKR